jgi:hypothetical protein
LVAQWQWGLAWSVNLGPGVWILTVTATDLNGNANVAMSLL